MDGGKPPDYLPVGRTISEIKRTRSEVHYIKQTEGHDLSCIAWHSDSDFMIAHILPGTVVEALPSVLHRPAVGIDRYSLGGPNCS